MGEDLEEAVEKLINEREEKKRRLMVASSIEMLDEKENLDKIIAEASLTKRRPAIVRMVSHVLDDKEESIRVLNAALRMADVTPSQRKLIVRNWASHLEVDDLDEILRKDEKFEDEILRKDEKFEEERKSPAPIEKEKSVKEVSTPAKKNKMKHVDMILLLGVIAVLLMWGFWPVLMHEGVEHETVIVYPANVVLDSFEDNLVLHLTIPGQLITIHLANYVSVTFQLNNTGDEVARDVSCFIKCCDQNGTILFAQLFTFGDIGSHMTGKIPASSSAFTFGSYHVPISNETMYVTHSIEVRWSPQGTNTYMKLTET